MVTIGTAFGEIEDELENMLDMVAESLDLLEDNKSEEAIAILLNLEDLMLTFLDYEEVSEEDEKSESAPSSKSSCKSNANNKPKNSKSPAKNSSKPKSAGKPKSKK